MRLSYILIVLLVSLISCATAWDSDEFEIYDLVEEVNQINQNFYEYMEITPEATTSEIRKAYRKLSLILHPDKNTAEDANLKFRWLAAIYETLKDPEKRKIYDKVLVDGLPDWRSPAFYFRRIRKIGLMETLAYLFVIVSVFQYFINLASYWEKKFTLNENVKANKKFRNANDIDDQIEEFLGPKPTVFDTLPFQSYRGIKYLIFTIPTLPGTLLKQYQELKEKKAEEERLIKEEEELQQKKLEEKQERKQRKKDRKRIIYDEKQEGAEDSNNSDAPISKEEVFKQPANANQIWTDVDLAKLAKLIKKYPAGSVDRWEKIADILERTPKEVTKMAYKIKDNAYIIPSTQKTQGITGLETKKHVPDNCMENDENYSDEDDEDSQSQTEEDSESEYDSDGLRAYTVANNNDFVPVEVKSKVKTKGGKQGQFQEEVQAQVVEQGSTTTTASSEEGVLPQNQPKEVIPQEDPWSQAQQKAFEAAIKQFPKGATERWERIANKVPGKTKDQCIQRFKTLAEMVKKKKEAVVVES